MQLNPDSAGIVWRERPGLRAGGWERYGERAHRLRARYMRHILGRLVRRGLRAALALGRIAFALVVGLRSSTWPGLTHWVGSERRLP